MNVSENCKFHLDSWRLQMRKTDSDLLFFPDFLFKNTFESQYNYFM